MTTCNQKQIYTAGSLESQLSVDLGIKYIAHASNCGETNCRKPGCQKMKRIIQHAQSCEKKTECPTCRHYQAICCHHAESCRFGDCPVPNCSAIRKRKWRYQPAPVLQTSPCNYNSSSQPLSGAQPHSSLHPPQPDLCNITKRPYFFQDYEEEVTPDMEEMVNSLFERLEVEVPRIAEDPIESQKLFSSVYQIRRAFQEKQRKLLRLKQEYISHGTVPNAVNEYVEELNIKLKAIEEYLLKLQTIEMRLRSQQTVKQVQPLVAAFLARLNASTLPPGVYPGTVPPGVYPGPGTMACDVYPGTVPPGTSPDEEEDLSTVSFEGKVCQDLRNLLLSEEFSDVTIKIGDQQFKAHWSILAARSPVFASMLRHDTKEKATGVVDVEDCELSSFPVFLEYVYCESTEKISSENVFHLYVSADKYDVQDLKRKCLEFMMTNLSVDNFCETLHLCLQHSEKKLLNFATEFFIRHFQEIILTPKWQTFLSENPVLGNELFIKAAKTFK